MTQERVLDRTDIKKVDFLFVDEFYKLDPSRDDSRYQMLNIALYKLAKISRQVFMAGPHISGIRFGQEWQGKFTFVQTNFRTVAVDIIDRSTTSNRLQTFLGDYLENKANLSIAFTASPGSARSLAEEIIVEDPVEGSSAAKDLADWLGQNYSPEWGLVKALRHGVGLHHGRLPRAVAQRIIDLFESSDLKILVCTSTLIEGVNTSAAIIYVYDKKINTQDFDFFSFANIRGRAGRMMRHFVGKVYLYHEPPEEVSTVVDVPISSDPANAAEPILFAVDERDIEQEGLDRRDKITATTGLSRATIERFGSFGVQNLSELRAEIQQILATRPSFLLWSGLPDRERRDCMFDLIFRFLIQPNRLRVGARSGRQLSFYVDRLRVSKTLRSFLSFLVKRSRSSDSAADVVEIGFEFFRGCDFTVPTAVMACQSVLNDLLEDRSVDWSFYATAIENCFRPSWVKALDERGIPFPFAEKLIPLVPSGASMNEVLRVVAEVRDGVRALSLDPVEQRLIANFS
ncbi:helicase-related protein [Neorhizobium alkalisoli]|nr:helicase-related protein [Neorhizobium alkalisoli]